MNRNEDKNRFDHLMQNVIISFYYGSTVYNTITEQSDTDIVCIVTDDCDDFSNDYNNIWQYHDNNVDYQFINESKWNNMIQNYHIIVLESLSLPDKFIIKGDLTKYKLHFSTIDLWKLRQTISTIAENAYAKCHKKLIIEKDFDLYRAKKSLFHSMRVLDFGKQIAENGKIINFESCNKLWNEIYKMDTDKWEDYKSKYKPLLNKMRSEFVKLCPKPIQTF